LFFAICICWTTIKIPDCLNRISTMKTGLIKIFMAAKLICALAATAAHATDATPAEARAI
jgi:hypothetical protein